MDFDFEELLREAGTNNRKATEHISRIDDDSRRDQKKSMKSLAVQRKVFKEELKKRAPPPPEPPRFVIPKKKKEEVAKVNQEGVQAFLRRKEEEKLRKMRQEREEREELIKHRMKESGGRASRKIAKHFGMKALDMQKKYGNDRDHEVALQRNEIREIEEHERLSSELRSGVAKAVLKNKEVVNKLVSSKTDKQEPFRVGTRKSNSMCGLTSRNKGETYKEPAPPTPGEKRKVNSSGGPPKKRPPPPALDFGDLMRKAKQNDGQEPTVKKNLPPVREEPIERPKALAKKGEYSKPKLPVKQTPSSSSKAQSSSASSSSRRVPEAPSKGRSMDSRKPVGEKEKLKSTNSSKTADGDRKPAPPKVPKKAPPPEPDRAVDGVLVPGKRYLPSDVRYKAALAAGLIQPSSSAPPPPRNDRVPPTTRIPARPEKSAGPSRALPASSSRMGEPSSSQMSRKPMRDARDAPRARSPVRRERDYVERPKSHQVDRRRGFEDRRGGYDNRHRESDDEYEDEEYDSEMDDFIDDTEIEDFQHRELEDTLKLINRNYDKKRWKYNEMMIDERSMQASFRDITREEMRSAKIGMYEDIIEAKRGSTAV
uniref:Protein SPT2 homolog n=1 Tax=Steinernema glaseri TaxID=37863 RepID=A0A1I7XZL2_9BILA